MYIWHADFGNVVSGTRREFSEMLKRNQQAFPSANEFKPRRCWYL